jgi:hypothetical protein
MTDTQKTIYKELYKEAERLDLYEFDFCVEMWFVMSFTWAIWMGENSIGLSLFHLDSSDFDAIEAAGLIQKIKEYEPDERTDPSEIYRVKYKIIKKRDIMFLSKMLKCRFKDVVASFRVLLRRQLDK